MTSPTRPELIEAALRGLMRCMTDWAAREDGLPEEYAEAMNAADTALYSPEGSAVGAPCHRRDRKASQGLE